MIGNTIIYRRKDTKEQIGKLNDTFSSLEEAMELYTYGYNLRKGDPKYAHLPTPDEVEAIRANSIDPKTGYPREEQNL
jgi:hypothetical protein